MSAKSKKSKDEQRAVAAANLKAAQEAVKAVKPKTTQNSTPTTSAPNAPDPGLLHRVDEFIAGSKIRFYCMKCKAAKSTKIDETYITQQGRKRAKGICPTCGKKVTRGHLDVQPKAV